MKDNIFLVAKFKKLTPTEQYDHASNPDDEDNDTFNVRELQKELIAERAMNRDLNQTVSRLLERMADIERDIIRIEQNEKKTETEGNMEIRDSRKFGSWCADQNRWTLAYSVITYEHLNLNSTNMEITDTPLNIRYGII